MIDYLPPAAHIDYRALMSNGGFSKARLGRMHEVMAGYVERGEAARSPRRPVRSPREAARSSRRVSCQAFGFS